MSRHGQTASLLESDRWAPLRQFVARWYSQPITDGDGNTPEEIEQATERIGMQMPAALAEWFLLVGRRLHDVQDSPRRLHQIEVADEAILMTDHTKFGQVHGYLVSSLNLFDTIITDTLAPPQDVEALRDMGIQVTLVEPVEDGSVLRPAVMSTIVGGGNTDDCDEP